MSSVRRPEKALCDDSHLWRVVDDLAHDCPVTPAELDAVEAFLMPLVHALLADGSDTQSGTTRAVSKRIESRGIPESGLFMIHDARRAKEAAEMALSDDLRKRVVEAATDGGMSRNAAAKRFGVSIASAVRWLHRFAATGEISPAPTGGDRRSDRIEAHRDYLLGLIRRQPDMTLLEIQERLIANCGQRFSSSVIWRFFDRHGIAFKKKSAHAEEQQRA